MFNLLYKYLVLHRQAAIPGVGLLVLEKEPARLDMEKKVIHAPLTVIKLKSVTAVPDKNFYDFIADELNISVHEAIKQFQDFASDLKHEVQEKKWVELPEVGILTQGVRDEIKFKSNTVLREYYPSALADKVAFAEADVKDLPLFQPVSNTEQVATDSPAVKKDLWWLFAIILFLIGVGAITYYYLYLYPISF